MPQAVLNLTEAEAIEYLGLPREVILKRYIRAHKDDKCPHCGRFIGNHSEKQLSRCTDIDGLVVQVNRLKAGPTEVPMIQCPFCSEWIPPAFACIRCCNSLNQPDIKVS